MTKTKAVPELSAEEWRPESGRLVRPSLLTGVAAHVARFVKSPAIGVTEWVSAGCTTRYAEVVLADGCTALAAGECLMRFWSLY